MLGSGNVPCDGKWRTEKAIRRLVCTGREKAAAREEAEHAAKFAELLGEVVTDSTEKNLKMRVDAEYGATGMENLTLQSVPKAQNPGCNP